MRNYIFNDIDLSWIKYLIFYKYLFIFIFIILLIFVHLSSFCINSEFQSPPINLWDESFSNFNIPYELNESEDKYLYLKNKTDFYFKKRNEFLLKHHVIYNESNLVTFQDKLNWLVIHESPQYKSFLVDKIKLHDYSKESWEKIFVYLS